MRHALRALVLVVAFVFGQPLAAQRSTGPRVAGVAICQARSWMTAGDTMVMRLTIFDTVTHRPLLTATPTWGVTDPRVASIDARGVVRAKRPGTVIVFGVMADPVRPGSRILARYPVTVGAVGQTRDTRPLPLRPNCLGRGIISG